MRPPIRISIYVLLFMVATFGHHACAQRLHESAHQQTPRKNRVKSSNHHHDTDDTALDVDDKILMTMEREWGMREMDRYKTMHGSWPLRHDPSNSAERETDYTRPPSPQKANTAIGGHSRAAILEALEDEDYFGTSLLSAILNVFPSIGII